MEEIKRYVHDKSLTAFGFCDPKDTPFYVKCGLGVIKGIDRFVFPSGPKSKKPGDTIYIEAADGLIKKINDYPNDKIICSREEW
jgi:hypothetical protein